MNKNEFLRQVGEINDKWIEEAEGKKTTRPRLSPFKLAAAAACFLMACAVLAIPFAGGLFHPQTPSENTLPVIWDGSDERFEEVNEDNSSEVVFTTGYRAVISRGDYQGYQSARVLDETLVGKKLGDTEIDSFLIYFSSGKTEDHLYLAAEVYEIRGISPSNAVCVRYLEVGQSNTLTHYYVFCNTDISDATWGDLWNRFAFDEYLLLADSARELVWDGLADGNVRKVNYCVSDASALREMLLSISDAAAVDMSGRDFSALAASAEKMITLSAQCLSSGQYGSIQILDNGYLVTGISGSVQAFDLGAERAVQIIGWIEENGEVTYSANNEGIGLPEHEGGTGSMSESTVTAETQTGVCTMPYCG